MQALIFPGQGSQAAGMGAGLFERFPALVEAADDVLGLSIATLCMTDPDGRLADTRYAQPAIYVVNALHHAAWREDHDDAHAWFAGHSLGEYNALLAAGAFDFRTGLEIVKRRGALFAETTGAMAAVIGLPAAALEQRLRALGFDDLDLANLNSADQTVIAGPRVSLDAAARQLDASGDLTVHALNVSGAFHSRYMAAVKPAFAACLSQHTLSWPARPVVSNVTARCYGPPGTPAEFLAEQLDHPVRWRESIRYMLREGVDEWIELGPGRRFLTRLVDAVRREPATAPSPVHA